jgi:hypothetical protein
VRDGRRTSDAALEIAHVAHTTAGLAGDRPAAARGRQEQRRIGAPPGEPTMRPGCRARSGATARKLL